MSLLWDIFSLFDYTVLSFFQVSIKDIGLDWLTQLLSNWLFFDRDRVYLKDIRLFILWVNMRDIKPYAGLFKNLQISLAV